MTNKDFFTAIEKQGFAGDIVDWYNRCIKPTDLFRFWFKDDPEAECDYYYIYNIITVNDKVLLGLVPDDGVEDHKRAMYYYDLDKIDSFAILEHEEDYI